MQISLSIRRSPDVRHFRPLQEIVEQLDTEDLQHNLNAPAPVAPFEPPEWDFDTDPEDMPVLSDDEHSSEEEDAFQLTTPQWSDVTLPANFSSSSTRRSTSFGLSSGDELGESMSHGSVNTPVGIESPSHTHESLSVADEDVASDLDWSIAQETALVALTDPELLARSFAMQESIASLNATVLNVTPSHRVSEDEPHRSDTSSTTASTASAASVVDVAIETDESLAFEQRYRHAGIQTATWPLDERRDGVGESSQQVERVPRVHRGRQESGVQGTGAGIELQLTVRWNAESQ